MYQLPYFVEKDRQKVIDFMKENYFAAIVGWDGTYPVATQIPLQITATQNQITLHGHIMRNTDHCIAFEKFPNVMVLFTGANAYISASWYSEPEQASTWNYMTVQAKGIISFGNEATTLASIKKVTDMHEGSSPAGFNKISDAYITKHSKAIVAIEIQVSQLENVFKLSQNKDDASKMNIIQALLKTGNDNARSIAHAIKERM